jgi:hypothetical protein
MTTATPITAPLPFFHHVASGRIFYIRARSCSRSPSRMQADTRP